MASDDKFVRLIEFSTGTKVFEAQTFDNRKLYSFILVVILLI